MDDIRIDGIINTYCLVLPNNETIEPAKPCYYICRGRGGEAEYLHRDFSWHESMNSGGFDHYFKTYRDAERFLDAYRKDRTYTVLLNKVEYEFVNRLLELFEKFKVDRTD